MTPAPGASKERSRTAKRPANSFVTLRNERVAGSCKRLESRARSARGRSSGGLRHGGREGRVDLRSKLLNREPDGLLVQVGIEDRVAGEDHDAVAFHEEREAA